MRGQRAKRDVVAVGCDVAQVGDRGEVNQRLGGAHATRKLHQHVGPPGDEPRLTGVRVEQVQRLGQRRRAQIRSPHHGRPLSIDRLRDEKDSTWDGGQSMVAEEAAVTSVSLAVLEKRKVASTNAGAYEADVVQPLRRTCMRYTVRINRRRITKEGPHGRVCSRTRPLSCMGRAQSGAL